MKCPKCHKEVEKGSLYCPYCLAEIPWVREFSTVETLMKKEQQNRPSEKKQKTEIIKYFKHPKRRKLKFSRKQLLCLLLCAATLLGFFCYRQLNTFSALYSRAKKQYAQQNYEEAQRIAEYALDKNPKNEAANLLLAKSMEKSGDKRSALLVLRPFIQNKTAGTGIYKEYVIVLNAPKAPKVIPKSGDYNKKTEIKITVPDGCKAYYAFDSEPDLNSTVYEQPISMPVGYHRLNVILVAANGKTSKMTAMEYYLQY